jgi:hypothetical protein
MVRVSQSAVFFCHFKAPFRQENSRKMFLCFDASEGQKGFLKIKALKKFLKYFPHCLHLLEANIPLRLF